MSDSGDLRFDAREWALLAGLMILSLAVFSGAVGGQLILEDASFLRGNPQMADGANLLRYFTAGLGANVQEYDTSIPLYRPVFLLVLRALTAIFGASLPALHVAGLIVYLATLPLVYRLFRDHGRLAFEPALLGTACFALMPAHVESIAWISGLVDPLVAIFLLAAWMLDEQYRRTGRRQYFGLALASFALALGCKETALAFPLLVWLFAIRNGGEYRALMGYVAVAAAYLAARAVVLDPAPGVAWNLAAGGWQRAWDFLLAYAGTIFIPTELPFFTSPPDGPIAGVGGGIALAVLVALCVAATRSSDRNDRRSLFFGAWAVLFAWPAVLLAFRGEGVFAVRFMYLPSIGLCGLLGLAAAWVLGQTRPWRIVGRTVFVGFIVAGAVLAYREVAAWRDEASLHRKMAAHPASRSEGLLGLGAAALERDDYMAARNYFGQALESARRDGPRASALVGLGTAAALGGDLIAAEYHFQSALSKVPEHPDAIAGLGNLAWMRGDLATATLLYQRAYRLRPANPVYRTNLLRLYESTGRVGDALGLRRGTR
jgi:tetratricopeptide (TPR) repeat protein